MTIEEGKSFEDKVRSHLLNPNRPAEPQPRKPTLRPEPGKPEPQRPSPRTSEPDTPEAEIERHRAAIERRRRLIAGARAQCERGVMEIEQSLASSRDTWQSIERTAYREIEQIEAETKAYVEAQERLLRASEAAVKALEPGGLGNSDLFVDMSQFLTGKPAAESIKPSFADKRTGRLVPRES